MSCPTKASGVILQDRSIRFDWGIAPVPTVDGHHANQWAEGYSVAMTAASAHKKEAWKLLQYIASSDQNVPWTKNRIMTYGYVSAMPAVNEAANLHNDQLWAPFLSGLASAKARPDPLRTMHGQQIDETVNRAFSKEGTPKEVLDEWQKSLE